MTDDRQKITAEARRQSPDHDVADSIGAVKIDIDLDGHFGFLWMPSEPQRGVARPWVWFAPVFKGVLPDLSHRWMFSRFLKHGISVAGVDVGESYGSPLGRKQYDGFYEILVSQYGMAPRATLLAQSRGGLMHYNWAADHPDKVASIAAIYPICDLRHFPGVKVACDAYGMGEDALRSYLSAHNPIDRLSPLAQAGVRIFHVQGEQDMAVPLELHSAELAERYRRLGGKIELRVIPGRSHEVVPEFFECRSLVDFVLCTTTSSS